LKSLNRAAAVLALTCCAGVLLQAGGYDLGTTWLQIMAVSTPSTPPGGAARLYLDSVTGEVSVRKSSGAVVSLEALGEPGGASLPSGAIILVASGSCPAGFTEEASLSGKFLLGTTAAAGNVGGTGGSDNVTPAGTISAHSGTAVADHGAHTHAYSDVLNHTHTVSVTDPGHTHVQNAHNHTQDAHTHTLPVGATDDTAAPFDRSDAGTNASGANATTASGSTAATNQAATAVNQSATTGITASTANPAGGVASGTTGTPSATLTHSVTQAADHSFTGAALDNRPAFVRVIFCRAN
jgi:hypothetical protein